MSSAAKLTAATTTKIKPATRPYHNEHQLDADNYDGYDDGDDIDIHQQQTHHMRSQPLNEKYDQNVNGGGGGVVDEIRNKPPLGPQKPARSMDRRRAFSR